MSYPYAEQPGTPGAPQTPSNSLATISMVTGVVGILGILTCFCSPIITSGWLLLFGVPAAITGWVARNQIAESGGRQGGENLATAGLIMGIAEVAIALFLICLSVIGIIGLLALPALEKIMPTPSF